MPQSSAGDRSHAAAATARAHQHAHTQAHTGNTGTRQRNTATLQTVLNGLDCKRKGVHVTAAARQEIPFFVSSSCSVLLRGGGRQQQRQRQRAEHSAKGSEDMNVIRASCSGQKHGPYQFHHSGRAAGGAAQPCAPGLLLFLSLSSSHTLSASLPAGPQLASLANTSTRTRRGAAHTHSGRCTKTLTHTQHRTQTHTRAGQHSLLHRRGFQLVNFCSCSDGE